MSIDWRKIDWERGPLPMSVVRELPPAPGQIVGTLYAFQALGTSMFKIGFSTHPARRLEDIQPYSPLPLRWVARWYPATRSLECDVHELLSHHRSHGEWFDLGSWFEDGFTESWNEIVAEALDPSGFAVRAS